MTIEPLAKIISGRFSSSISRNMLNKLGIVAHIGLVIGSFADPNSPMVGDLIISRYWMR
jgi:hypothetical protein